MKVIDLLNKMSNDDNYKPTFKFRNSTYKYNVETKYYEPSFMGLYKLYMILNDEVEIIEEEKEIKKIPIPEIECIENERILRAEMKINELIDEVNKLKEEK